MFTPADRSAPHQPPTRPTRPHLVLLAGGRAGAPAPFVVAPPDLLPAGPLSGRVDSIRAQQVARRRAEEADLVTCRRIVTRWR